MSISFYGYVLDGNLWTWPDAMRDRLHADIEPPYDTPEYQAWYDGETECRNPNYDRRLDVNGDPHSNAPIPIDVFEIGLRTTIARNPDPIPGLEGCNTVGTRGCRMISPGTPDGYVNVCLDQLLILVAAAREYGATHIGWS